MKIIKKVKGFSFRDIPHPGYGNYGGAKKRCESHSKMDRCPAPIDVMDWAFYYHDLDLRNGVDGDKADRDLVKRLKDLDPKELKEPVYGRAYRLSAIAVFEAAIQARRIF